MLDSPKQPNILPVVRQGQEMYVTTTLWDYEWEHGGRWFRLSIEPGFFYDGASVPRLLWSFSGISPDGLHRAGALPHDFIYRHSGKLPSGSFQVRTDDVGWKDLDHGWSREEADRLFGRILRECGVNQRRRRIMYYAVRLFGWLSWKLLKPITVV